MIDCETKECVTRARGPGPSDYAYKQKLDKGTKNCGAWSVISECESGEHHFAKKLYCGREWCQVCGKMNSPVHNRRIARILPKAMQIESMGYFVIEFPDLYRKLGMKGLNTDGDIECWCYSKKDIQNTTNAILNIFRGKRIAGHYVGGHFSRGLLRWHWYGKIMTAKWNPHVNILVDGAYIDDYELENIKSELRLELNIPNLIVNYSYHDKPGEMYHKVEYITRSTFLDYSWSPYMAEQLYNFRNQRWWGQWNEFTKWTVDKKQDGDITDLLKVSDIQRGKCPSCGKPLKSLGESKKTGEPVKWTYPIDSTWLIIWNAREIAESGYYEIVNKEWYGGNLSPCNIFTIRDTIMKPGRKKWR